MHLRVPLAALAVAVGVAYAAAPAERAEAVPSAAPEPVRAPVEVPDLGCDEARPVRLPVRVFNREGTAGPAVEAVTFNVGEAEAARADEVWLWVHAPVYRDVSVRPRPKFSVRLNGGPWVDLETGRVRVHPHEAAYGGLNGAYHSVRLSVPLRVLGEVRACDNALEVRFNGTDGVTIGGRVFDLNVRDSAGADLLPDAVLVEDDPAAWTPIFADAASVEAGRELWASAPIAESPLDPEPLAVGCGGCHAADGLDLWYFGYDDRSIVARSTFHGLTEREGQLIASYVRSLGERRGYAYAPPGRPWNPPFQPGPGLASRPVHEWAAGMGLEAVLEHDSLTRAAVDPAAVAGHVPLDLNEVPVAIQFPDWNEWLPDEHPRDVYGPAWDRSEMRAAYDDAVAALERRRPGPDDLEALVEHHLEEVDEYRRGVLDDSGATPLESAAMQRSLLHWGAVKTWELHRAFELEGLGPEVYGPYGEARTFLGGFRDAFSLAPHIVKANGVSARLPWQSELVGKYFSTAWYEVQMRTNTGNVVRTGGIRPVDWNYQPNHIGDLSKGKIGGPGHGWRYLVTFAKLYQLSEHADDTPYGDDFAIEWRQMHPARWAPPVYSGLWADADVRAAAPLMDAMLSAFLDRLEAIPVEAWTPPVRRRTLTPGLDFEGPWRTPALLTSPAAVTADEEHAAAWYWMVPAFRGVGVSEPTLARAVDWGEAMWPNGDWDALRTGGEHEVTSAPGPADAGLRLSSVSPNPLQGAGTVEVSVATTRRVRLVLVDALGRRVGVLHDGEVPGGAAQTVPVDVRHLPSGTYTVRARAGRLRTTTRFVVAR